MFHVLESMRHADVYDNVTTTVDDLRDIFGRPDIVSFINVKRVRWLKLCMYVLWEMIELQGNYLVMDQEEKGYQAVLEVDE